MTILKNKALVVWSLLLSPQLSSVDNADIKNAPSIVKAHC
ncbi:hypothetical protein GNIT_0782 [Glaciecola nitratireducens FR1064]|uniref:Uncharacterized protein n=1 Tax=Glaciecola nitratireducens (strain JCM 12485 / KCTC 12276 / FR1064) TaxID=1085623 RepID=G4QJ58_GLANF|nr:hypothetical protein GNIT_0782 [Glaciecola nitratireducens FR1064]